MALARNVSGIKVGTSHWQAGESYRGGKPNLNKPRRSFDLSLRDVQPTVCYWEFVYRQPPGMTLRETRKAAKEVGKEIVIWWGEKLWPKHFIRGAGSEYHYQRRKGVTIFLKRRFYGHTDPLVKKGNMYLHLKMSQRASSTSTGGRLRMLGPWYTRDRGQDGNQPDKPDEMTRVSPQDARVMAHMLDVKVRQRVRKALLGKVERGRIQ